MFAGILPRRRTNLSAATSESEGIIAMQSIDQEFIFQHAIEIAEDSERIKFLDQSCSNDPQAKKKLVEMIDRDHGHRRILDETRACGFDSAGLADVPVVGSVIGPYKLLQEIGEGGMGIVFMAQQSEPMKRKVALKVIKIGMDTRRVVARFESERQAMALMDHPSITKILDAGATESGRPYFVMELVRGSSITSYCDEHRLSLRQRLEIFVQVCNALEHAHQKGIIHRDIKPNNIMVTNQDGRPTPKIIDFGIAKAINDPLTEKTLFTNYGEMIGTPLYMSPEQSEMSEPDVDTRTDIYSLGVLLYELLTGTTPFDGLKKKGFHEIRQAIRSNEPQLASTRINNLGDTVKQISSNRNTDVRSLHRFIRGELDWILVKCLARDRNRRYQSAGEVSREIVRYLNGELVEAAAPTWRYRTQKFVTRHKTGVAVAASFAILLVAGTVFSTMMALKANKAEKLASSRLELAIQERDRARTAEKQLGELERKQRNRVAFHQAASSHNADMVKKYLAEIPDIPGDLRNGPRPVIQVKPMGSYWETTKPDSALKSKPKSALKSEPKSALKSSEIVTRTKPSFVDSPVSEHSTGIFEGDEDNANIEVIVVSDQSENRESLLKSILHNQRKAFGGQDVLVAQTLNQLGELTSDSEKWGQSEEYFREAFEILNQTANDKQQLSAVRMKLVNALEKQGNFKHMIAELQDIKENSQHSEVHDEVSGLLDKIKLQLRQTPTEEKPENP
jgi:serine/threonine protein kinase